MRRKGFTLVEIMIVVAIIALLAAIAIPSLINAKKTANQAAAKASVRNIATAAETYATANSGTYPTQAQCKDYIASIDDYCSKTVQGYTYTCTMDSTGYTVQGAPATAAAGSVTYTATTGGVLTPLN